MDRTIIASRIGMVGILIGCQAAMFALLAMHS